MIFAFGDDGGLTIHESTADAIREWEGIDVESGAVHFYDEHGTFLEPRFTTPNRTGKMLGVIGWVESGVYELVPNPTSTEDPFALALLETGFLNPNRWYASLEELKAALAVKGVAVEYERLERFVTAQHGVYEHALAEIRAGRKRSHWMWFIFPQIAGLGHSPTSQYYAIRDRAEAMAYLQHPLLGPRLAECGRALLALTTNAAPDVFGHPDDLKLRSSMTLFAEISEAGSVFHQVIEKYFGGESDQATLRLLESRDS